MAEDGAMNVDLTEEAWWAKSGGGSSVPSRFTSRMSVPMRGRSMRCQFCAFFGIFSITVLGLYGSSVYMKANQHYKTAVSTAASLDVLDTSRNSITRWLQGGSTASPEHPRRKHGGLQYRLAGPGMPVKNFQWTYPKGAQPPKSLKEKRQIQKQRAGDFLRLPVGVATALMQQRLSQEQKLGVQFAASSDEPKWSLLKTLRQQIPDAAFLRADAHRLAHIQKLLKWASDAKVVTEVGPLEGKESQGCSSDYLANDPQCMSAEILQKQLTRFEEEPRVYDDVMRYPFSSELLYWGSFKVLRFHGRGLLFHRNGMVAYNGTWVDGAMSGEGELLNEEGQLVWKGEFGYLPSPCPHSTRHDMRVQCSAVHVARQRAVLTERRAAMLTLVLRAVCYAGTAAARVVPQRAWYNAPGTDGAARLYQAGVPHKSATALLANLHLSHAPIGNIAAQPTLRVHR